MAGAEQQELRREIREERARLTDEVGVLRGELARATNIGGRLRSKLPVAAAGALGLGFLASGGIGATMRLLMRRSREGEPTAKAGRFELIRKRR